MIAPSIEAIPTEVIPTHATGRALRKVVVVRRGPGQSLPDSVMDADDYDVVVIESMAHAYSQVKRSAPNLVIMCVSFDNLEGFRVLSMLKLDTDTARIPLLTYASSDADGFQSDSVDVDEDLFHGCVQVSMN